MALSVSIELVSSSARVTSAKSTKGVSVSDGHPDPKIGPQVYLDPIKNYISSPNALKSEALIMSSFHSKMGPRWPLGPYFDKFRSTLACGSSEIELCLQNVLSKQNNLGFLAAAKLLC